MSDRAQCPFCLAYVKVRADGNLPHHRLSSGKLCSGSDRTREQAKQAKAEGEPTGTTSPSGQQDLLQDDIPF